MEDIVIKNATIVTMNSNYNILNNSWISIKENKISGIGTENFPEANKIIDAQKKIVMPGLINTHTHASMNLLKGIADDMHLNEWLFKNIFPLEDKFVNEDFVYWGTKLAIAEMLLSGTTCFNDMYYFPNKAAEAAKDCGMRAVIASAVTDINSEIEKEIQKTEEFLSNWKDDSLISPSTGPHSIYTCSPELLKRMKEIADKNKVIYHIHVSETEKENNDSIDKTGKSPFEYLNNLGILSSSVLAAHCVHLSENDIRIIKKYNIKIAHNPISNAKLASGTADIQRFLYNNIIVSLGTDGSASNNNLNLFEEMKFASLIQKAMNLDPTILPAKSVIEIATINGAKALSMENKIGSIEIGKLADLIK